MMETDKPRFGKLSSAGADVAPGMERIVPLVSGAGTHIEGIISRGAASPAGFWYDQQTDEFVLLVTGTAQLGFADGSTRDLNPGDWAFLPAHCRHRVNWTDPASETLWLAVHLPPG